jgi:sugar phosphate isomerase/epimerase
MPPEIADEEHIDFLISVNFKSTVFTNQAAFRHMKERGGRIVNFGSIEGVEGTVGSPVYAATRGAVQAWTRSAARAWGKHHINVNAIAPIMHTKLHEYSRTVMSEAQLAALDKSLADRIGLDYLTMTGVDPVHFIRTAAAAGACNVALCPQTSQLNPYDLPYYSLVRDAGLRNDTIRCLADHDVTVQLIDALAVRPDLPVRDWRPVIEACPLLSIASLAQAVKIVEAIGAPNVKLLIDTMHITRSGEVGLLSRIDPSLIDYVQISDGLIEVEDMEAYGREATLERAVPGEGEMPLEEILSSVPAHVVVSGEVPMHARRSAGMSDLERSRLVVASIERLLARLEQRKTETAGSRGNESSEEGLMASHRNWTWIHQRNGE